MYKIAIIGSQGIGKTTLGNEKQKSWYKNLPNFDAKIFEEITGIKIDCDCKDELKKDDIIEICKDGKRFKVKILE